MWKRGKTNSSARFDENRGSREGAKKNFGRTGSGIEDHHDNDDDETFRYGLKRHKGTRGFPLAVLRNAVAEREIRQIKRETQIQMLQRKNALLRKRLGDVVLKLSSDSASAALETEALAAQHIFNASAESRCMLEAKLIAIQDAARLRLYKRVRLRPPRHKRNQSTNTHEKAVVSMVKNARYAKRLAAIPQSELFEAIKASLLNLLPHNETDAKSENLPGQSISLDLIQSLTSKDAASLPDLSLRLYSSEYKDLKWIDLLRRDIECSEIDDQVFKYSESDPDRFAAENIVFDEEEEVMYATIEGLVQRLTDHRLSNLKLRPVFLLTFRTHTSPRELLRLLMQRYFLTAKSSFGENLTNEDAERFEKDFRAPIQIKVVSILKKWVDDYFSDFSSDTILQSMLKQFICYASMHSECGGTWTNQMLRQVVKVWKRKNYKSSNKKVESSLLIGNFPVQHLPRGGLSLEMFSDSSENSALYSLSCLELARQMALVEFKYFSAIDAQEFLGQGWAKKGPGSEKLAPNIRVVINRFNIISGFVTSEIVSAKAIENRVRILSFWIEVAEKSRELKNFHSLYAIYTGLNATPVFRLKKTWARVSKSNLHTFAAFKQLLSASGNMKNLRNVMQKAVNPCMPHIGIFLGDLTFIEDGNASVAKYQMINFDKLRRIAGVVEKVQECQHVTYNFFHDAVLEEFLDDLPGTIDPKQLYRMSLACEGKST